jgi:hypothetical protein
VINGCTLSWCPCDASTGCGFCAKDGDHLDKCIAHNPGASSRPAATVRSVSDAVTAVRNLAAEIPSADTRSPAQKALEIVQARMRGRETVS